MKSLRRCFCVLLCCVLLLGAFSVNASAAEIDVGPHLITESLYINYPNGGFSVGENYTYTPNDGIQDTYSFSFAQDPSVLRTGEVMHFYEVISKGENILADGNIKTTVRLENIYYSNLIMYDNVSIYDYNPCYLVVHVTYIDDTRETFDASFDGSSSSFLKTLSATFTPSKDVKKFSFELHSVLSEEIPDDLNTDFASIDFYCGEWAGDGKTALVVKQPSEEASLLDGILGWIQNIFNGITDGFAQVGQKLIDLWDAINSLPQKIWELIESGLKSLFVPDEDKLVEIKSQWEELLSSKFGAVWEVVQITFGSWENINANDQKNSISIPEVEIPLPDGESFSFGGDEVQVVPSGFETIAEICKMATGAFCTLMFINGLRKRYDEVMAVEQ